VICPGNSNGLLAFSGCVLVRVAEANLSQDTENRISRVLDDLRPQTPFPGQDQPPQTLAQRMAHLATPGVSVAVIEDFEVAWHRGFGKLTAGANEEVTSTTLFQVGSISKPVFALAVMRLVEEGRLDLDADVNDYLASWQIPTNDGWLPRVTLRQLLSHTAGTTVHGFPGYPAKGLRPTIPQVLNGEPPANNQPVVVDLLPGAQFRYSGGGTTIAQQVVLDVMSRPFADLMRELILDPLGMTDSTFEQPLPAAVAVRAATAHPWNGVQTRGGWHVYPEMAAAGLWTTAGDLARLGTEVMRTLRGDRSTLGLKQDTVAEMLRPQLPDQKVGQDFVGLGWFCSGQDNEFEFGHQGGNEGYLAEIGLFPAQGRGAVVINNSIQGWPLREEIIKSVGREYGWPSPPTMMRAATAMPPLMDYSGRYTNHDGVVFEVAQTAEGLLVQFDRQTPIPIKPGNDGEFFATAVNLRIRFEKANGAPPAMNVVSNSKTIALTRVGL
jgi:CubicO group peptidase (beta-lactamase class C family)